MTGPDYYCTSMVLRDSFMLLQYVDFASTYVNLVGPSGAQQAQE